MFYKEFFSPIPFGGKFQGQKLDFQGQLLAFQGQKLGAKSLFPRISGAKIVGFRGKNGIVESWGFYSGAKIQNFRGNSHQIF
ncbi:hypothetical protein HMJ48_RS23825 [Escherichia coli]|nr:hypothetical protein [Escherichia coli]ELX2038452.1 hypothetical protein [Escherichia coli]